MVAAFIRHILPTRSFLWIGKDFVEVTTVGFDVLGDIIVLRHATTTVTEKCYVKFREAGLLNARRIMEKNTPDVANFVAEEKAQNPYKSRLCGIFFIP